MQILIISGFLGAGKTRFIQKMAEKTGRQFVIVENEFGELGVDGALLNSKNEAGDGEMKVWELSEGCICCSLNLDFAQSVLTIANALDPDYLIVEPSGVAHPTRIVNQLTKIRYERIGLLAPVTIIDAVHYRDSRREHPTYFYDQLDAAGTVVLSKSEELSEEEFQTIARDLELPSDVHFKPSHYDAWDAEDFWTLLRREYSSDQNGPRFVDRIPEEVKETRFQSLSYSLTKISSPDELIYRLEEMIQGKYGCVVRSKGIINMDGRGVHFELVDGVYQLTGIDGVEENRIIVIGTDLKRVELYEALGPVESEDDDWF